MSTLKSDGLRTFVVSVALVALTVAVYSPVAGHRFLIWDDDSYTYENPNVRTGLSWDNFVWSWGIHGPGQWHPLAWWSHQLDCELFGIDNACGHHVVNLLLHTAAALVLLAALRRLTGMFWPSAIVAFLFALHPLGVESVAWIAERRDVLSALFWGLTLWAYAGYAQREGRACYALTFLLFVLAVLAKPVADTLPCVLLLLDYWPLRRFRGLGAVGDAAQANPPPSPTRSATALILEKVPMLAVSCVSACLSFLCQWDIGAIVPLEAYPFSSRLANAAESYVLYLRNMLWPWDLSPMYPLPTSFVAWQVTGAVALLLLISAVAVWQSRRRPYLLMGWLWYLGTLLPMIGLLRMGIDVAMADRYVYLPLIGIYIAAVWGIRELLARSHEGQAAAAPLATLALAACVILTHRQVKFWKDDDTFNERAIVLHSDVAAAHCNLGITLLMRGRRDEAIRQFREVLRGQSDLDLAHFYLALALRSQGRADEALDHFRETVKHNPQYADAYDAMGNLLVDMGKSDQAIASFKEALRLRPGDYSLHSDLARALQKLGKSDEAIQQLREALRLEPDAWDLHYGLGNILMGRGKTDQAIEELKAARDELVRALHLNPESAEIHRSLGNVLVSLGKPEQAVLYYQEALRFKPSAENCYNLASAQQDLKQFDLAERNYREALRLKPDFVDAHNNLGMILAQEGLLHEAAAEFRAALKVQPDHAGARNNLDKMNALLRKQPSGS